MDKPRKIMTLCLIHKHPQVLLGMKKRGFGAGKWNGFGGKVGLDESIEDAARRELMEEAGLSAGPLEKVAIMDFEAAGRPEINEVHIFKTADIAGEPAESEEMLPKWFHIDEIPYDKMWPDDAHWFPPIFDDKKLRARFLFDEADNILDMDIKEVDNL